MDIEKKIKDLQRRAKEEGSFFHLTVTEVYRFKNGYHLRYIECLSIPDGEKPCLCKWEYPKFYPLREEDTPLPGWKKVEKSKLSAQFNLFSFSEYI